MDTRQSGLDRKRLVSGTSRLHGKGDFAGKQIVIGENFCAARNWKADRFHPRPQTASDRRHPHFAGITATRREEVLED